MLIEKRDAQSQLLMNVLCSSPSGNRACKGRGVVVTHTAQRAGCFEEASFSTRNILVDRPLVSSDVVHTEPQKLPPNLARGRVAIGKPKPLHILIGFN